MHEIHIDFFFWHLLGSLSKSKEHSSARFPQTRTSHSDVGYYRLIQAFILGLYLCHMTLESWMPLRGKNGKMLARHSGTSATALQSSDSRTIVNVYYSESHPKATWKHLARGSTVEACMWWNVFTNCIHMV